MITLYGFGEQFGLTDLSPFVSKAHMLLRMAKLEYKPDNNGFSKAPKGKLPYINDNGKIIADSTFIKFYLEKEKGVNFDSHLSASEKATAWAFEKMCENHLYFAMLETRWLRPENFEPHIAPYFDKTIPFPINKLVKRLALRGTRQRVHGHGMGKHKRDEIEQLAKCDLKAVSDFLGEKPYFMGSKVSSVDATIFAFVSAALCEEFKSDAKDYAKTLKNLTSYCERMKKEFFTN